MHDENDKPVLDYPEQAYLLSLVDDHMLEQYEMWGVQDHPLVGGTMPSVLRGTYRFEEAKYKGFWRDQKKRGVVGWDTILLEEVYEALSTTDPDEQFEELIQVAAVAVNAAMSVRRNKAA